MLLYHYTHITTAVDKINEDAALKIQRGDQDNGLKPALWFSENNKYETSAFKGFINQETGNFNQGTNIKNPILLPSGDQFNDLGDPSS